MTGIDLGALEATARAATPSEWHVEGSKFHDSYGHGLGQTFGTYWRQNAAHIAAFDPPTVLALIARLREAEAAIEATEGWVTAHYLDTHMGEKVLELLSRYKTTKTERES